MCSSRLAGTWHGCMQLMRASMSSAGNDPACLMANSSHFENHSKCLIVSVCVHWNAVRSTVMVSCCLFWLFNIYLLMNFDVLQLQYSAFFIISFLKSFVSSLEDLDIFWQRAILICQCDETAIFFHKEYFEGEHHCRWLRWERNIKKMIPVSHSGRVLFICSRERKS